MSLSCKMWLIRPYCCFRIGRKYVLIIFHAIAGVSLVLAMVCTTYGGMLKCYLMNSQGGIGYLYFILEHIE